MKRPIGKRLTAWLLSLALAVTLLPGLELTALAAEEGSAAGPPAVETADGLPITEEPAEPPDTDAPAEPPVTDEPAEPPALAEPAALPSPNPMQVRAGTSDPFVWIYSYYTTIYDRFCYNKVKLTEGWYIKSNNEYTTSGQYKTYQASSGQFPSEYVLYFKNNTLYMNGYEGGTIDCSYSPGDIKIQVQKDSTISLPDRIPDNVYSGNKTPSYLYCIVATDETKSYDENRTLTITSASGSTLFLSGSTRNDLNEVRMTPLMGMYSGFDEDSSSTQTSVALCGNVTVDIDFNHKSTCGIRAEHLKILDHASLNITQSADQCNFYQIYSNTEQCYALGIDANTLTVDTAGSINMDLSKVQSGYPNLYSRGLRLKQFNGFKIPYMKIKWSPGDRWKGGHLYNRDDTVTNPPSNVVVQKQSDQCIYRTGTPVDLTLEDCEIREAWDSAQRNLFTHGPFIAGDKLWLVQTRVPELPILYWQIGDYIGSHANWFFPELEVTDDRATIKPVFRLGEPGKPVFEWLNGSGGIVRHNLNSSQGLSGIKLLDGDNKVVSSTWEYDSEKQELTVAVESISPGEAYRLTAVKGSTLNLPKLYTEWFRVQSVQAPEVTTDEGYYYKSIELGVDVPTGGTLYYKEGLGATINEWDRGTDYSSEHPLILDGGNSNPAYWTMRVRQEDIDGNINWSAPTNVDTSVWTQWVDTIWETGDPPPPVMSVNPKENRTYDLSNSEVGKVILTGPVDVNLHWSLPSSKWPMNARLRYTTDPDETDKRNFQYYTRPIHFDSSGGHLRIVTSARDAYGVLYYSDVGTYNFIPGELPSGVTVSGTAVSWNGTNDAVYLLYPSAVDDAAIKNEWKNGTYTTAAYTATKGGITKNTDGNRYNQTFSFSGVASGQYKLAIFKPGKYVPKIVPITVEGSPLDLGEQKLWLYGDVTYDGIVDHIDVLQINRKIANLDSIFDAGSSQEQKDRFTAANVTAINGTDTILDYMDVLQINRKIANLGSVFDLLN